VTKEIKGTKDRWEIKALPVTKEIKGTKDL
jgi:hypothetical protein